MAIFTDDEIEEQRQQRLAEIAESGLGIDGFVPGSLGFHEALHTASIQMETFEQYVLEHPAVVRDPELYAEAHLVFTRLFDFYQALGTKHPPQTAK
jgi:hypothetical protein